MFQIQYESKQKVFYPRFFTPLILEFKTITKNRTFIPSIVKREE